MKLVKNIFLVLFIYIFIALLIFECCAFFLFKVPDLELINIPVYYLQQGCLLFINFLPSLCISGILVGYSWAFGKEKADTKSRFSTAVSQYLKTVFIIGIICTALCFICVEVISPLIRQNQKSVCDNSNNIIEFMEIAQKDYEAKDYFTSNFYVNLVLDLESDNQQAMELAVKLEKALVTENIQNKKINQNEKPKTIVTNQEKAMTIPDLMNKANECFVKQDYFNAHYYSSLVLDITPQNDGNRQFATQLATESWNKLEDIKAFDDELSKEVFSKKKQGYFAILEGDYSKAYYVFNDLYSKYPLDQDVQEFYGRSKDLLLSRYFFIDETFNLQQFEQYSNVYFSLVRPDGGKDVVSIKGITVTKKTGSMLQYLRGLSIVSYDKNNQLLMKLTMPYAKLCSCPIDNISPITKQYIHTFSKSKYVPYIFLQAVNRDNSMNVLKPKIEYSNNYKLEFDSSYILPIPYEDFSMICDASQGSNNMPLISLFRFAEQASDYGYSSEVFSHSLISRLTYPILILICFIISSIIGWETRLFTNDAFKFRWLFMFPLTTLIAYTFLELLKYMLNLLFYVVLGVAAKASLLICLIVLTVILFLCSLRFLSLKSN